MSSIRKANREDARLVSEIAEATFRAAFAAMNTAEHMDLHCRTSYAEHIQAAEISNPGMVTLLSEVEGRIVGYAQVRWDRAPGCVSAKHPGEIQRLYVVKDMHGKGLHQGC